MAKKSNAKSNSKEELKAVCFTNPSNPNDKVQEVTFVVPGLKPDSSDDDTRNVPVTDNATLNVRIYEDICDFGTVTVKNAAGVEKTYRLDGGNKLDDGYTWLGQEGSYYEVSDKFGGSVNIFLVKAPDCDEAEAELKLNAGFSADTMEATFTIPDLVAGQLPDGGKNAEKASNATLSVRIVADDGRLGSVRVTKPDDSVTKYTLHVDPFEHRVFRFEGRPASYHVVEDGLLRVYLRRSSANDDDTISADKSDTVVKLTLQVPGLKVGKLPERGRNAKATSNATVDVRIYEDSHDFGSVTVTNSSDGKKKKKRHFLCASPDIGHGHTWLGQPDSYYELENGCVHLFLRKVRQFKKIRTLTATVDHSFKANTMRVTFEIPGLVAGKLPGGGKDIARTDNAEVNVRIVSHGEEFGNVKVTKAKTIKYKLHCHRSEMIGYNWLERPSSYHVVEDGKVHVYLRKSRDPIWIDRVRWLKNVAADTGFCSLLAANAMLFAWYFFA